MLRGHRRLIDTAQEMAGTHLAEHGGYVAWSGGKDSTIVAELAHRANPDTPIVTYVAGTEYPEVLPFCAQLALERGWNWEPIQTGDITVLLDRGGIPADDGEWWDIMIAGPARVAHERHGLGLLWGMRGTESRARAAQLYSTRGIHTRKTDGVTTCAPLWRWTTDDVYAAHRALGLPLCPTYEVMERIGMPREQRRVGRVIGRRNMADRLHWLRLGWPELHSEYTTRWPWLEQLD